jgi:hypothetical protein
MSRFFGIGIDNYAVRRVSEDENSRTSLKPIIVTASRDSTIVRSRGVDSPSTTLRQ